MLTPVGKVLRKLRIDHDERLADMGERLGKSASFLSAVEVGKKSPPEGFEEEIIAAYELSPEAADGLCTAADRSRHQFVLKPESERALDTIGLLARRMSNLTDDSWDDIHDILKRGQA